MSRKYTTLPITAEFPVADNNFDANRKPINKIIIHTTVGTLEGMKARFNNPSAMVSANYGIGWGGELYTFLEEYYVAYAAGNYSVNQESISIEHVDNGNYTAPRPDALYETSAKLVADICKFYNIECNRERIRKHNEIVATGCPHNLDIDRIVNRAKELQGGTSTPTPFDPCEAYKKDISFKNKVIGERDAEIVELKKQLANIPPCPPCPPSTDCSAYINQIQYVKDIVWGKGWVWVRMNKLKAMFPK